MDRSTKCSVHARISSDLARIASASSGFRRMPAGSPSDPSGSEFARGRPNSSLSWIAVVGRLGPRSWLGDAVEVELDVTADGRTLRMAWTNGESAATLQVDVGTGTATVGWSTGDGWREHAA